MTVACRSLQFTENTETPDKLAQEMRLVVSEIAMARFKATFAITVPSPHKSIATGTLSSIIT